MGRNESHCMSWLDKHLQFIWKKKITSTDTIEGDTMLSCRYIFISYEINLLDVKVPHRNCKQTKDLSIPRNIETKATMCW